MLQRGRASRHTGTTGPPAAGSALGTGRDANSLRGRSPSRAELEPRDLRGGSPTGTEGTSRGRAAPSAGPGGRQGAGRRVSSPAGPARPGPSRRYKSAERGQGRPEGRPGSLTASQRVLRALLHSDSTSAPGAVPSANMAVSEGPGTRS